ncbi:hypothetical protein [Methanoculleus sp.]|uniref:hypothetical protein n=1 Tax=Methanoculleus sp. TaxID=90427 RepID=UPI001BD31253|nr:hypothetical protein [Methanoculleus sp.]
MIKEAAVDTEWPSDEELESLDKDSPKAYNAIKPYLTDYVTTVVPNLFREAGGYAAKYDRSVSFPAHIVTAVLVGATLYLYNRQQNRAAIALQDVKLLCTALTLHDIHKFWNEKSGASVKGNYRSCIEKYYETDPFHLKDYFPEWNNYLDEIVFFVQNAQESDEAGHESRCHRSKFGNLLPFIKLGDKVASWGKTEYSLASISDQLSKLGFDAHLITLPDIPQQLLSQVIYRSVKRAITDGGGIPLLLSTHGILYLSPHEVHIDSFTLKQILSEELIQSTDAMPVMKWGKFLLDPLISIPLDVDARFQAYLISVKERTEAGLLSKIGKTTYPEDRGLQESIACLSFFIYNDSGGQEWTDFPELERCLTGQDALLALKKIGEIRQSFATIDEIGVQKCKVYTVYELVRRSAEFKDDLIVLHPFVISAIRAKLDQDSGVLDSIVKKVFTQNSSVNEGLDLEFPKGGSDVCFMCGAPARTEYKPGEHFIQSGGFTKRTTLHDQYKRYCDACQLELQLLNRLVENSSFKVREDLLFFYFYFDYTFANLDAFSSSLSRVGIHASSTQSEANGLDFTLGDFRTPFHMKPMAVRLRKGQSDQASKTTRRARAIHTALKLCTKAGCRCIMTAPFTTIRMQKSVFYNDMPNRLEKAFGLDDVDTFSDAKRKDAQLDLIRDLDRDKGLYRVQAFKPEYIIPFAKRHAKNFEAWVTAHNANLCTLFGDEDDMAMRNIAHKGVSLFGMHRFSGSHKKVKIFRTTLESLMNALAQGFSEDEAVRFAAAEVMKDVEREQFSKKKGKDIPEECLDFVRSVADYLKGKRLWNVSSIAKWENPLTDLYEYEYICATKQGE